MHTITLQPLPLPSPRGHTFSTCVAPVLPSPRGGEFSTCRVRSAFTLVELLVVIVILAMLASLVTVAGARAMTAARNAAIKAEIDMLHMAIMNYKNEYGSFPPCVDTEYDGNSDSYTSSGQAAKHIARLFPRCTDAFLQLNAASSNDASRTSRTDADTVWLTKLYAPNAIPANKDLHLIPHNAITAWLYGFTNDPTSPLNPSASRSKLFDFDQSRISSGFYAPSNKPKSPYIYIDKSKYPILAYAGVPSTIPGAELRTSNPVEYFNPDTFQILCAGRDEIFGTDDDLSNFWPGTRKDYLDSVN
jgi:prepilin-type N-terminal cleavage/methylation domain-containing protein